MDTCLEEVKTVLSMEASTCKFFFHKQQFFLERKKKLSELNFLRNGIRKFVWMSRIHRHGES